MTVIDCFSITSWSWVTLFAILATLLLTIHISLSYRRLAHIPGPYLASISPIWLFYQACRSRIILANEELHCRYGRLVRISTDQISTDEPELWRLATKAGSPFTRGQFYDSVKFDPRQDNVLSTKDKKAHAALRSKLSPGYHGKDGINFEVDIDPRVTELLALIRHHAKANKAFDFAPLAGYFTLDSLTKIAFGNEVGFLRENRDIHDYFRISGQFLKILEFSSNHPWLLVILNLFRGVAAPSPTDRFGLGAIMGEAQKAVAERFKPDHDLKNANDMLSSFIRRGLNQLDCEAEAVVQIIGGTDSTAQAIRNCFICIISNPIAYSKLNAEISKAVDAGTISHPVIKTTEADRLPYLQACIKEGLRWFMPLNGLIHKLTPSEGFTYSGILIPGGTQLAISIYAMLRRKDIFGPDADTFRPERWLDGSDVERIKYMETVQSLVFGTGPTSCLGRQIALLELNKVVFELFRNYDFCLVNPLAEIKTKCNGAVNQKDIIVRAFSKSTA